MAGVHVGTAKEVEEYFASEALSQSKGKRLLEGISSFLSDQKFTGDALDMGSAVDTILTGEEGEYEKNFHESLLTRKPTAKIKDILDFVATNYEGPIPVKIADIEILCIAGADFVEYYKKRTNESRMKDIKAGGVKDTNIGQEYLNDLLLSKGKTVLTAEQVATKNAIVLSLRNNDATYRYFDRNLQAAQSETIDFYYQLPIYFTIPPTDEELEENPESEGIKSKALLDFVVVIRNDEGVIMSIEPYDLKTMGADTNQFLWFSFKKRRYDIQAAWYTMALISMFEVSNSVVQPFKFIVESTTNPGHRPLVYTMSEETLSIGMNGRPAFTVVEQNFEFDNTSPTQATVSREVKGVNQILDLYRWHNKFGWEDTKFNMEKKMSGEDLILTWDKVI